MGKAYPLKKYIAISIVMLALFAISLGVSSYLINNKVNETIAVKGAREIHVAKQSPNPAQSPIVSSQLKTLIQESFGLEHSGREPDRSSPTVTPIPTLISAPTPTTSPSVTPSDIQEIAITLSGQVYNDLNCNNTKQEDETGLENKQIAILQLKDEAEPILLNMLTTDANGNYSFSKIIQESESLTIQPVPGVNLVHTPQEATFTANNTSFVIDVSSCP